MSRKNACVFIISSFVEPNVDLIIQRLTARNVRWCRFNTETFPLLTHVSLYAPSCGSAFAEFVLPDKQVDTREITAVWHRRSGNIIIPDGLTSVQQDFVRSESLALVLGAYECMECFWVNPRHAEVRSGLKTNQAVAAKEIGLTIPDTLVTNDPVAARMFVASSSNPVLFKAIGSNIGGAPPEFASEVQSAYSERFPITPAPPQKRSENKKALFSQILTPDKMDYIDSIIGCPVIFQKYIEKRSELRITIVGNKIFAAEIRSQEDARTKVDFRRMALFERDEAPLHTVHTLPDEISTLLLRLMNRLGLVFGCVDMILTPEGQYVFLEVNPAGQWGWIEQMTQMPITDAVAELLIDGQM